MENNINETQKIIEKILSDKDLYFWSVKTIEENRAENYFIFGQTESKRQINIVKYKISIFILNKLNELQTIGDSSGILPENCTVEQIQNMIDKLIVSARLVNNPFYEIKNEKFHYNKFNNCDSSIYENPYIVCDELSNKISSLAKSINNAKLSTTELFTSRISEHYSNSSSNRYSFDKTKIMLEGVFLAGPDDSSESYFLDQATFLDELDLEQTLKKHAKYANDSINAATLPTGKYKVIFSEEALEEFFNFYLTHASALAVYNKFSLLKLGEPIILKNPKTPLTIKSDPFIPGGASSRVADDYGIPLKPFSIIENNKMVQYISDLQYSQYLNLPYTGPLTNYVINPGTRSIEEIVKEENIVLLLRFSAFSPKEITGDFSSEIRLGYITKNGKQIPIKGGSVSGNIRNLIDTLELSSNIVKKGSYIGPDAIVLDNVDISGV